MTGDFTRLYERAMRDLRRHTPGIAEAKLTGANDVTFRIQPYSVHLLIFERS